MTSPHITRRLAALAFAAMTLLAAPGCQRRTPLGDDPGDDDPGASGASNEGDLPSSGAGRALASRRPSAGATCGGRDDCTSDQACVEGRCRPRATSVSGEILAAAARGQAQAGDWAGAIQTYEQAFGAFSSRDVPVPPEIACDAAELILRTATEAEERELGAQKADLCFRSTVPGHPARQPVSQALARLRFEGLDIGRFDAPTPPDAFFTLEASRPTVDAVRVHLEMPDIEPREPTSHGAVREVLVSDDGRRAVAECFIQDWELHHERAGEANIGVRYSTNLRDMGSYDVYVPEVTLEQTGLAEEGFEPCLVAALAELFGPQTRSIRGESWTQVVQITATIQ